MEALDLTRVLKILRSLYPIVQTIQELSDGLVYREERKVALVEASDNEPYKVFVKGLVVCSIRELQQVPSSEPVTTFPELLALVLNNMKRKKKRNVLGNGYLLRDAKLRDADVFKLHGNIAQSALYLYNSDYWKKLNLRLGTDLMKYLLESCAVFVSVPPSCMYQVCGTPMYDLVATVTSSSFLLVRPRQRTKPTRRAGGVGQKKGAGWLKEKVETRRRKREAENGVETGQPCPKKRRIANLAVGEEAPSWRTGKFPPPNPSTCFIRILGLLYGGRCLRNFLLNRKLRVGGTAPRRLQGGDLVRLVFFEGLPYLSGAQRKPKRLPQRFHAMVGTFTQLLRAHRKCPYIQLLQQTCPAGGMDGKMVSLLTRHSSARQVYLFIRECLHRVVPMEMWGSAHNKQRFLYRVKGFLALGKFDRLSVSELLWKARVNDCDWLKISTRGRVPPSEHRYRQRLLGQFLTWLLDGYVVGLVRALFYVTEGAGQKNALRFYRQHVWARLQEMAFRNNLSKGQWQPVTSEDAAPVLKNTLISRLRYIPKSGGMRPIVRMVKTDARTRSHQARLKDLYDILRVCARATPSSLGSTVFGMDDIYRVLGRFAAEHRADRQPLYFVKVDVCGAYDSLPHDKLLQVVTEVLSPFQHTSFSIRCYAQVWAEANNALRKAFHREAGEWHSIKPCMKSLLMALQEGNMIHDAILVEQYFSLDVYVRDILKFFRQMIDNSVILFGKKMFRQVCGIPQGSVVSMLLCCLCYGHMENMLFQDITDGGGCLLRLVDDFLLITPDENKAQSFLRTLLAGVPAYGCFANPGKVAVNFSIKDFPDVAQLPFHCLFPWCGLLLDTNNLNIYNDYSSYAGLSLRYSLTLGSTLSAGQHMQRKLLAILKLKCHAIFLDLKVNCLRAVYLNIYKIVLIQAYRFHACAQNLPFGQKVSKNPAFFVRMIWTMAKFTNQLIRQKNKGVDLGSKGLGGSLQYEAVELLYCMAFLAVLARHRGAYKHLLTELRMRKRRLGRLLGELRLALVCQAATPPIPLDFKPIRD